MNFYTVSPVRFDFQGQVKRTIFPVNSTRTNVYNNRYKVAGTQDSVHFGNKTHTYEILPNKQVEIKDHNGQAKVYTVGLKFSSQGKEMIYSLYKNGDSAGTITGTKGASYSSYTLDDDEGDASPSYSLTPAKKP